MSSIRARLTAAYAAALVGTMLVFVAALWGVRRSATFAELERHVTSETNQALSVLVASEEQGQPVAIARERADRRDSLVLVTPMLRTALEGFPDYVVVLDRAGRALYFSLDARLLDDDERSALQAAVLGAPTSGVPAVITIGDEELLLAVRSPSSASSVISRVAFAASTAGAKLAVRELLMTMLLIVPVLLVASVMLASYMSARALRPVDLMVDEVRAITDGRSLHRRLPVNVAGDEIERLAMTLNDMMERLERSFAALRRFTADASHELKTPLMVLRADIERAMSPASVGGDGMVALEEALHETTRMADLVESLLTLARADEGRFDLHREPVDLEALVRDVFETTTILGESAGLTVTMPTIEPGIVLGDRIRLRQLFLNLATNAIKYTPRGGSVEIRLARGERTAAFSVKDTGIGIAGTDLPHVFERFYRADRARSRGSERGGFGLGLAISQWIAEAHGGMISVRSRLLRGSTFTVTIPLAPDIDPDAAAPGRDELSRRVPVQAD